MGERSFTKEEEQRIIVPIAVRLSAMHQKGTTTIVGMQGGQGTGKTTIVEFLQKHLKQKGYKVQSFSLDDFYQSYVERMKLQKKYPTNSFYQISRGMPGTHRVKLLLETLRKANAGKNLTIPIFDKSLHNGKGDVLVKTIKVKGRQDFVILEGWCVGMPAVSSAQLLQICKKNGINIKKIDPKLKDHKVVLGFAKQYQSIWRLLDYTIMIKADSPEVHKKWRLLQETRLKQKKGKGMSKEQVHVFVEPFLPFTYACYDLIKPDVKVLIDEKHRFYRINFY